MRLQDKFCSFIKVKREAKGLSQEQLAKLVWGESGQRSQIYQIESQYRGSVNFDTMDKILKALKCEITFVDLEAP